MLLIKSISLLCCLTLTSALPQNYYQGQQSQNYDYQAANNYNNPQPQYTNQQYSNPQPQPQYEAQAQPRYLSQPQPEEHYDEKTKHALNNGEYIGDGDYHGEGLQESGAYDAQNNNPQNTYDYGNNYNNNNNNNNNYYTNNGGSGSPRSQPAGPDHGYSLEISLGK